MNRDTAQASAAFLLTDRFGRGLEMALELHGEQRRKGSETPYIAHLLGVTSIVIEEGGSEDQAIAALLHDAPEDAGGEDTLERIRSEFGEAVARIVEDCTDTMEDPKPPWRRRKEAYLHHLDDATPEALLVSLADKLHNARAILLDYRELEESLWERFRGSRDEVLWYYRSLVEAFNRLRPGRLADELERIVAELERLVNANG
jgi:(p)ppGpp synthase/HD superfamily hydrolase